MNRQFIVSEWDRAYMVINTLYRKENAEYVVCECEDLEDAMNIAFLLNAQANMTMPATGAFTNCYACGQRA